MSDKEIEVSHDGHTWINIDTYSPLVKCYPYIRSTRLKNEKIARHIAKLYDMNHITIFNDDEIDALNYVVGPDPAAGRENKCECGVETLGYGKHSNWCSIKD